MYLMIPMNEAQKKSLDFFCPSGPNPHFSPRNLVVGKASQKWCADVPEYVEKTIFGTTQPTGKFRSIYTL